MGNAERIRQGDFGRGVKFAVERGRTTSLAISWVLGEAFG